MAITNPNCGRRAIAGVVTQGSLVSNLVANRVRPESPVESVLYKQFKKIYLHTTLGKLSRILDTDHFALVVHEQKNSKYFLVPLLVLTNQDSQFQSLVQVR